MATVAQIQANRLNAQKSTGPRTAVGKERASRNALQHGLLARGAVIAGEDPAEFEFYREGMLAELGPAGAVEAMLAARVVGLSWRLRRAERLQNAAFAALDEGEPTEVLAERFEEWKQVKGSEWDRGLAGVVDEDLALGKVVVADFAEARVLDRLLMYERRIESSLYRTMAQLRRERQARAAAAEPEERSRSEGNLATGEESVAQAELGSFGAEPGPKAGARGGEVSSAEGVSNLKCQVSSGEEASGDRSDFPLRTSHFKLAKMTPHGVTTNEDERTPAEGPVGVVERGSGEGDAGMEDHGRDARATRTLHESSCETNPICPSDGGAQVLCGNELTVASRRDAAGETKPIAGLVDRESGNGAVGADSGR